MSQCPLWYPRSDVNIQNNHSPHLEKIIIDLKKNEYHYIACLNNECYITINDEKLLKVLCRSFVRRWFSLKQTESSQSPNLSVNWYKIKVPFMAYWTTSVLYLDLRNRCFCLNVWNRENVQLCELFHGFTMISTKAYRVHYWIIKNTVILIALNGLPVSNVNTSNTQQCKKNHTK